MKDDTMQINFSQSRQDSVLPRIKFLGELIARLDREYYVLNMPSVSDLEYDKLLAELAQLEREHPEYIQPGSPSGRVAGEPLKEFGELNHETPMLSLGNSYNISDLREFETRVLKDLNALRPPSATLSSRDISYCVELKFDGLSISLVYKRGVLHRAATRGNGRIGEDVTQNIKTIKQVPLTLPLDCDITVRGEIFMPRDVFASLNKEREEAGEQVFANPRNAAAGSVRQLDSRITRQRKLNIFLYNIASAPAIYESGEKEARIKTFERHSETLSFLSSLGFCVCENYSVLNGIEEVIEYIEKWDSLRHNLNYDTDGMVVKIDALDYYETLGYTAKSPRFAIAYKYAPERAETLVESIEIQVGKMGTLTPVANLKTVALGGTKISRASLHNAEEIAAKDIRVGDYVIIEKAGEIIPQVVEVVFSKRPEGSMPFEMPSTCPACGSKVIKNEGEVALRCSSISCKAQLVRKAQFFVSKHALDFEGFGEKIVESLVENGVISNMADILKLTQIDFLKLPRFGDKLAEKLSEEIASKKNTSLARLITALQIPLVGETTAAALASHFKTMERFIAANADELLKINEVGERIALSIKNFFENESNMKTIEAIFASGLKTISETNVSAVSQKLAGATFVLTGTLPVSREKAEELIETNGGSCPAAVSKKTSYLLLGENPGSKYEKALKLGVKVISYEDLLKLVE